MKKIFLIVVLNLFSAHQSFAIDNCHQAAIVAQSEFDVCTQYDQVDRCFTDFVLKTKPEFRCEEWEDVCLRTSQIAGTSENICY